MCVDHFQSFKLICHFEWNLVKRRKRQSFVALKAGCLWSSVLWVSCGSLHACEVRGAAQHSRTLRQRVNSDSAVSGNIHLHAETLIGMPHSILHAFNTFHFSAGLTVVHYKKKHPYVNVTLKEKKPTVKLQNKQLNKKKKIKCILEGCVKKDFHDRIIEYWKSTLYSCPEAPVLILTMTGNV